MKKLSLIVSFFVCSLAANAQNYLWASSAGGTDFDVSTSVTTDANGNSIVTGLFYSPTISFGSTTLTNAGIADIFIVKYNASGDVLWAKSAGGNGYDNGTSIATDANGSIIVTGGFGSSAISFDSITLTNAGGGGDIFIVKYDASGNVLWAKSAGGSDYEFGRSIATDDIGNIIVTGGFYSPSISFGSTTFTNAGAGGDIFGDIFIVKYDASGNVLWAKSAGGTDDEAGFSIATDANGNIIVTGLFYSPSISFDSTTFYNYLGYDFFIVKYDVSGNVLWAKSTGGDDYGIGYSIATDANGNSIVTGSFAGSSISFGSTTLTNAGWSDIFIVKYDASGNVLWAKSAGGTYIERGYGISTDANGNIIVTGFFASSSITFDSTTLTNAGMDNYLDDIFIVKYDASGNVLWAEGAGGTEIDNGLSVATDVNGNSIVSGSFKSSSITLGPGTFTNAGESDMFLVKLDDLGTGITENLHVTGLDIFPNPFSAQTTLYTERFLKDANLTVYNIHGQLEKQINHISGQTVTLSCGDLTCGLYFIQLSEDNRIIATGKLSVID